MIYLGYRDSDTNMTYGPGMRPAFPGRPVQAQAALVAQRIRSFLNKVAIWEATYLLPPGALAVDSAATDLLEETVLGHARLFPQEYITAESSAIDVETEPVANQPPRYRLACNRERAMARRRGSGGQGYDVSWVFDRLHYLSTNPDFAVYVWDVNIPDGARFLGLTLTEPPATPRRIILVDGWVWNERQHRFFRRDGSDMAETFIHEIVVHAYRDAATMAHPVPPDDFLWGSHTSYPYHQLLTATGAGRHSQADIEADILTLIHRGRPPVLSGLSPAQQADHDRYVETLRLALTTVCGGGRTIRGRTLTSRQYDQFRVYCPNPAGAGMRLPGPAQ